MRDYIGRVDPNLTLPDDAFPIVIDDVDVIVNDPVDLKQNSVEGEDLVIAVTNMQLVEKDTSEAPSHVEEKSEEIDLSQDDRKAELSTIQIQAEDYGGGIALPHYGFKRPSADYFNSNLMGYNFVVADVTSGKNHVFFYDERHQGKGADALCSLRLRYHLNKTRECRARGVRQKISMSLLDNCVGQNKSQLVMKFFCMLSLIFYDRVALLFFLPGHSHMIPDRVVAYCKCAIKRLNLYTLGQIAQECNRIQGVNAE